MAQSKVFKVATGSIGGGASGKVYSGPIRANNGDLVSDGEIVRAVDEPAWDYAWLLSTGALVPASAEEAKAANAGAEVAAPVAVSLTEDEGDAEAEDTEGNGETPGAARARHMREVAAARRAQGLV